MNNQSQSVLSGASTFLKMKFENIMDELHLKFISVHHAFAESKLSKALKEKRGDVPGWVLVVLMTTGLVTAIWAIAAPRLTAILRNALDSMNGIR